MSAMSELHADIARTADFDLRAAVQIFTDASVRHGNACGYPNGAAYALSALAAMLEDAIAELPPHRQQELFAELVACAAGRNSDAYNRERLFVSRQLTD